MCKAEDGSVTGDTDYKSSHTSNSAVAVRGKREFSAGTRAGSPPAFLAADARLENQLLLARPQHAMVAKRARWIDRAAS